MTDREDGQVRADSEPADTEDAQVTPAPAQASPPARTEVTPTDEVAHDFVPARVGCRTHLSGWAGAHSHGAVRPRRRAAGRGRPPGRWC